MSGNVLFNGRRAARSMAAAVNGHGVPYGPGYDNDEFYRFSPGPGAMTTMYHPPQYNVDDFIMYRLFLGDNPDNFVPAQIVSIPQGHKGYFIRFIDPRTKIFVDQEVSPYKIRDYFKKRDNNLPVAGPGDTVDMNPYTVTPSEEREQALLPVRTGRPRPRRGR